MRRLLAWFLSCLVVAAGLVAPARPADARSAAWRPPALPGDRPVAGAARRPAPAPADPTAGHVWTAPAVDWPRAGVAEVDLAAVPATGRTRGVRAGTTPVWVRPPGDRPGVRGTDAERPGRVRVEMFDRAAADRAGVTGPVFRVSVVGQPTAESDGAVTGTVAPGPVSLSLDYSGFREAIGGDWATRLRLVRLPECAVTSPGRADCRSAAPVTSHNDPAAGWISADEAGGGVFALTAAASGSAGDYAASPLTPSATWQVDAQTGDVSWGYPLRVPPPPGPLAPKLGIGYSSGSVDGRTVSTNNQPSWIGEGFDYSPGFVERSYKACVDDNITPRKGDLCWAYDNATLSLNGRVVELIRDDDTGAWRPKNDDGSRIERLTGAGNDDDNGEYWRVTAVDGTQYYFGRERLPRWAEGDRETNSTWVVPVFGDDAGEPCHGSTFADSWCRQAWRWNLDYVVDPHGNAMSFFYAAETNYYGRNLSSSTPTWYHRGGYLTELRYGQRADALYTATAPARVLLGTAERCLPTSDFDCAESRFTKDNAKHWPDVPFDQHCGSTGTCDNLAPSFWSRKRLTAITTQVLKGGSYQDVDTWSLEQQFLAPGDGTSPSLWLSAIRHTGKVGGRATIPDVRFGGIQLDNRVDAVEGIPPMTKWRISSIDNGNGGLLSITYSDRDCTAGSTPDPATNTRRCFPQYWTPEGYSDPKQDWFHKYVVTEVVQVDRTGGGPMDVTSYDYLGGAAWHYDDDDGLVPVKRKTWSQWRGYGRVKITRGAGTGPKSVTETIYFRGMDDDRTATGGRKSVTVTDSEGSVVTDADPLAGLVREELRYAVAGGSITEAKVHDQALYGPVATRARSWGTTRAYRVREAGVKTRVALGGGGWRRTRSTTVYDDKGLPTQIDDAGDVSTTADDLCTRFSYARATDRWMLNYLSREEKVAVSCQTTPSRPGQVVSDERTLYDDGAFGSAPTRGNPTRTEEVTGYADGVASYLPIERKSFDGYGRVTAVTDALGNTITTTYSPASGGLTARVVTSNPKGFQTTEDFDPAWHLPVVQTDPNGKRTELAYDPLGRLVSVWKPGRSRSSQTPNITYEYLMRDDAPATVSTATLTHTGGYATSYQLYDGLLRTRQTQDPAPGGGRVITDTSYDSRGNAVVHNDRYYAEGAPGGVLFVPASDDLVPGQTITEYDGMGRPTAKIFRVRGTERWRTTTSYQGDRIDVTPPPGGTAATKIVDARGQTTELRQYRSGTPTGGYDSTRYTYTPSGQLGSVTDATGHVWRYDYDLRDRKISESDPDKGVSGYVYDDLDRVISTTDARGITLASTFDELGRQTGLYEGSTGGAKRIEWSYDTVAKGRLSATVRYVGGQAYRQEISGYDDGYRPTDVRVVIPSAEGRLAGTYVSTAEYNVDGSPHRMVLPAGGGLPAETMLFDYNELGMPTTTRGLTTYVTSTSYSKLGQPLQTMLSAGGTRVLRANYYEEGTNRLRRVLDQRETAPSVIADTGYEYDPAGDITKITDAVSGAAEVQCFRYDHLQRLTEAWTPAGDCAAAPSASALAGPAPYWQSFSYDAGGRRLSQTDHTATGDSTQSYSYPAPGVPQPNGPRTVSITGGARAGQVDRLGYDSAGNVTTRAVAGRSQTMTWDPEGHLATVTENGSTTGYVYDADGNRLLGKEPSAVTLYLFGSELRLDTATNTVAATRYYSHGGQPVAVRTGGRLSWLLADHHGTPTTSVDEVTQQVTRRRFTPYGEARGTAPGSWPGSRGYVGGTADGTGLVHLGAREYDPRLGIFMSVDPVNDPNDPQQIQPYAYARNNPVTLSDPDGRAAIISIPVSRYYYSVYGHGYRWVVQATVSLVVLVFFGLYIPLGFTVSYRVIAKYPYGPRSFPKPHIDRSGGRRAQPKPHRANEPIPQGNLAPGEDDSVPAWMEDLLDKEFRRKLGRSFIPGRKMKSLERTAAALTMLEPPPQRKPSGKLKFAAWWVRHIRYEGSACIPVLCVTGTFQDGTFGVGHQIGVFAPGGAFGIGYASAKPSDQATLSEQACVFLCAFSGKRSGGRGEWYGGSITSGAGAGVGPTDWTWAPWGSVSDDMRRNPQKWESP